MADQQQPQEVPTSPGGGGGEASKSSGGPTSPGGWRHRAPFKLAIDGASSSGGGRAVRFSQPAEETAPSSSKSRWHHPPTPAPLHLSSSHEDADGDDNLSHTTKAAISSDASGQQPTPLPTSSPLNKARSTRSPSSSSSSLSSYDPKCCLADTPQVDPALLKRTSGWLFMRGGSHSSFIPLHTLKRRFFTIRMQSWPIRLCYYGNPDELNPQGTLSLEDSELVFDTTTHLDNNSSSTPQLVWAFQMHFRGGKIFDLAADSEEEQNEWISTLNNLIMLQRNRLVLTQEKALMTAVNGANKEENVNNHDEIVIDNQCIAILQEQANRFQAMGPGLSSVQARVETHVSIKAPEDGDPLPKNVSFTVLIEDDNRLYSPPLTETKSGVHTFKYCISAPGHYKMSLLMNDMFHIQGSPFDIRVEAAPAVAHQCIIRGEGLAFVTPGEMGYFTVTCYDAMGHAKVTGGDKVEVHVEGAARLKAVHDNLNGTYSCSFKAKMTPDKTFFAKEYIPGSGPIRISVSLDGKPLPASPFYPRYDDPIYKHTKISSTSTTKSVSSLSSSSPQIPPAGGRLFEPKRSASSSSPTKAPSNRGVSPPPPPPPLPQGYDGSLDSEPLNEVMKQRQQHVEQQYKRLEELRYSLITGAGHVGSTSAGSAMWEGTRIAQQTDQLARGALDMLPVVHGVEATEQDQQVIDILQDSQIHELLSKYSPHLAEVFDHYAAAAATSSGSAGGKSMTLTSFLHLAEDFDIIPSFMNKKETRQAFEAVARITIPPPCQDLPFNSFTTLISHVAILSLSKPAFHKQYPNAFTKTKVLLDNLGLADRRKLNAIRKREASRMTINNKRSSLTRKVGR